MRGISLTGPIIFNTEKEIRPTHNCAHLRLNYQENVTTPSGKEGGGRGGNGLSSGCHCGVTYQILGLYVNPFSDKEFLQI